MTTRLPITILLLALTACVESSPPVNVGEVSRGPDSQLSTVEVIPVTGIPADGQSTAQVRVMVRDRNGRALAGQEVAFTATGTGNTLVQPPATGADGVAVGTLASTRAETKTLTVRVGPADKAVTLEDQPEVTFIAGDAARIIFITQPPGSTPAGQPLPTVQVRVEDAQGNVVVAPTEVTLTLEATNGATLSGTATRTTAGGAADFDDLSVEMAGTGYTLSATAPGLTTPAVSTPFDVTAGVPDSARTTLEASRTSVTADGTDFTTLTVTVRDSYGNPVSAQPVSLAVLLGSSNVLTPESGTTGADGTFTATLTSTLAEIKTVEATVDTTPVPQRRDVTFVPGPPDRLSFLIHPPAPPAATVAGQLISPAVQVQVVDAQGNRVSSATLDVTLALVATNGATLQGTPLRPAEAGVALFADLNVLQSGTGYTLSATAPGIPTAAVSNAFDIVADTGSPLVATVEASPTDGVVADGTDFTTLTVTVSDRFGNPVSGQAVDVSASGSNNTLSPTSGTTGADGTFTATLRSTRAEVKSVEARLNGSVLAQHPDVTFVPGPPAALAFVTQPLVVVTAGAQIPAVQVEMLDAGGNRVTGSTDMVTLTLEDTNGTGATLLGTTARALVGGLVPFDDLSIEVAGDDYELRASAPGVTDAVSSMFSIIAGEPTTTNSNLLVAPDTVVADDFQEAVITVVVRDAYDNPVPGQPVVITASGVANTLVGGSGDSDLNGWVVARLRSSRAELKNINATVNGLPLTANSVTFVAGPVSVLGLIALPEQVEADGVEESLLTATAEDAFGNRVPGAHIVFTANGSDNVFDPGDGDTDANGQYVTALRSITPGVRTVSATVTVGAGTVVGTDMVTFLRPSAQVSGVMVPGGAAAGCATLQYTVAQSESAPVDVIVEYEEGGLFKRATQAGADIDSGVQGVTTSPVGVTHVFHWNSTADLPASNAAVTLRVTTQLQGALPRSATIADVPMGNGMSFAAPGLLPAGAAPSLLGRADLNGDGRMDVVVGSPTSNDLQVLLGDGAGSFGAPTAVTVGVGAAALLVRDLDSDGRADVLVGSVSDGSVFLLKGTGSGTFNAPALAVTLQSAAAGLAAGDFNRDGRLDLVATTTGGAVEIALASTPGVFGVPSVTSVGGSPGPVVVADFNHDARLDLVFGDPTADVKTMGGTGSGTFGAATALGMGPGAVALAVADLNDDGQQDVVAARSTSGTVSVAQGLGNGTFSVLPAFSTGGQPAGVAVADVDVDGRRDVVVTGVGADVLVLRGQSDGSLSAAPEVLPAGGPTSALALLDADRSGRLDMVATRAADNGLAVLINTQVDRCERSLAAGMQLPVSTQPSSATVADLDKDGRMDLVVAAAGTNTLNVARGRGNGMFAPFTVVPLGAGATNPQGVTAGDFNGDGLTDLVSSNQGTNNISLLLDDGAGGFTVSTWNTGTAPRGVASADFDGDGKLDVVVANSGSGNVTVLYGNGDGTFPFTQNHNVGNGPLAVAVADFNGDGRPDIAAVNSNSSSVTSLRNNGARSFTFMGNHSVGTSPRSIALGDFNQDNKVDVVVANYNSNSVSVLPGNGDATFGPAISTAASGSNPEFRSPLGVAVGDFNQDGVPDVATANFLGNSITLLEGLGNGRFNIGAVSAAGSGLTSLLGADLDGDGRQDLVATVTADSRVSVLRGTSKGIGGAVLHAAQTNAGATATALGTTVADINRDGKPDLLVANRAARNMSLLLGDGTGGFTLMTPVNVGTNPTDLAVADVNRDGNLDVLVSNSATNNLSILVGDGNGGFTASTHPSVGSPKGIVTLDLNGDGALDLAVAGSQVHYYINNGTGGFGSTNNASPGGTPLGIVTADFNGDGRPDVATTNLSSAGTVGVLLGNGTGGFQLPARTLGLGANGTAIAVGDLDWDGKMDLAVAIGSAPNYEVRALKGVGDGTFTAMASLPLTVSIPGMDSLAIGDVDGDGRADIAATAQALDNLVVWRGDGMGGFSSQPTFWSSSDITTGVALADLNEDGLVDVVTGGATHLGVLLGR